MIIRNAVRANEHDAVVFVGSGVTGAVHKLINCLSFRKPPVIFVGPYEHHSNLLPWREIAFCVSTLCFGIYLGSCYMPLPTALHSIAHTFKHT